ncbi:hypothetical protein LT493_14070 [Streptomyces tricolor]|nr:hypothetical protein [Streptomyces tricolor]
MTYLPWKRRITSRAFFPAEFGAGSSGCGAPTPSLSGDSGMRAMPLPWKKCSARTGRLMKTSSLK